MSILNVVENIQNKIQDTPELELGYQALLTMQVLGTVLGVVAGLIYWRSTKR